jgi:predicted nucleic acid-binding protein
MILLDTDMLTLLFHGHPRLLIASIALAEKARLSTRNGRDFGLVPGLTWENWAD